MDVWYARLDESDLMRAVQAATAGAGHPGRGKRGKAHKRAKVAKRGAKVAEQTRLRAHARDSLQALSKLGEVVDGRYRIVGRPRIVIPEREMSGRYEGVHRPASGARRR